MFFFHSNTRTLEHSNVSPSGFSLVELLIVMGIIAVLSGVLIATFGGANESANAAKCMANMRNLAVAAQNFNMSEERFPSAGTYEITHDSRSGTKYGLCYGWISGFESKGLARQSGSVNHTRYYDNSCIGACQPVSAYYDNEGMAGTDRDQSHYAITNGALWTFVGNSKSAYRCPSHEKIARKRKVQLHWSYVMNGYFGFSENGATKHSERSLSSLTAPNRVLLFAEMPFVVKGAESSARPEGRKWGVHSSVSFNTSANEDNDAILQYDTSKSSVTWSPKETIGFNHVNAKKACAHVAFADGHVAKISTPADGSEAKMVELTRWLCTGLEIVEAPSRGGITYSLAAGEDE